MDTGKKTPTKLKPVHCRVCKREIDRNTEQEGVDWIMPSKNFYYCVKCYKDWKVADTHSDEEWVDLIYDFIARDLKVSYDFFMCEAQRKKFISQNHCTNKGIYFALKYFYEINKGDWSKSNGGIGIIPYVYKDATAYWTELELKRRGTLSAIEQQIRERQIRPIKEIKRTATSSKKKERWSLD